jgi:hypothetical protein
VRYFYDTEFIEDGSTIDLISIGVVAEDGREYYAVSSEFNPERAGSWVRTHVLPKLPPPASLLCQLWGPMTHLPPVIPRFTHELRQLWEERGSPKLPPRPRDAHDALVDARDQLRRYQVITSQSVAGK